MSARRRFGPTWCWRPSFLLTIGILIPFFVALFTSFTDLTLRSPEYEMVGFQNYIDTFTNPALFGIRWA